MFTGRGVLFRCRTVHLVPAWPCTATPAYCCPAQGGHTPPSWDIGSGGAHHLVHLEAACPLGTVPSVSPRVRLGAAWEAMGTAGPSPHRPDPPPQAALR